MTIGDKIFAKTANISVKENILKSDPSEPKTSPGRLLDIQGKINAAEERVLFLQKKLGKALILAIDKLLVSHLQTRKLNQTRVSELAEHLSKNELTTPIVVRPSTTSSDKFEIVAGHHRVEAFKQLGRTEIEATIRPMKDQEAQKRIFFDNLMAPDLPDFEKYKGFAAIRRRTGQSYDALAKDAGIKKSTVGQYFAFERFPEVALKILSDHPEILGANAAQTIASLNPNQEKLVVGLKKIITGDLDQTRIIAFLKNDNYSHQSTNQYIQNVVKKGQKTVCTLRTKNKKNITLKFGKDFDANDWHHRLVAFIEKESDSSEQPINRRIY